MLPVQILKQNAQEERGESARLSSFVGAIAIGDLIKSTLGPKGMVLIFFFIFWLCGCLRAVNKTVTVAPSLE